MKKRIALVLALVMIFTLMPVSTFALSATGSGSPRTVNETGADDIAAGTSGKEGSIRVTFNRDDFHHLENTIRGNQGIFEMRVQLDNGEAYAHVDQFEWNLPGMNHHAQVVGVFDENGNALDARNFAGLTDAQRQDLLTDEFRVQFFIDPDAVDPGQHGSNVANFTVRALNMVVDGDDEVTADLSANYYNTNDVVRQRTYDLFGGWDVWTTVTLFNIADDVLVSMDTEKWFARGGMWNDIGMVWFEETVPGAFPDNDTFELELERGFYWDQAAQLRIPLEERDNRNFVNRLDVSARGRAAVRAENDVVEDSGVLYYVIPRANVEFSVDSNIGIASKRVVEVTLPAGVVGRAANRTSKFSIEGLRIMADRRVAEYGPVTADVDGGPSFSPDELVVAHYGETMVEITRNEDEPATVWSGKWNQELSELRIKESMWEAIPRNATIELTLPEGVKWHEPTDDTNRESYLDEDFAPQLENTDDLQDLAFVGFTGVNNDTLSTGQTNDIAWYVVDNNRQTIAATVSHESTDRENLRDGITRSERLDAGGDRAGADIVFENIVVAINSQYQHEDIEVEVEVHGWSETVVLGHAKPAVEVAVEEVADVKLGVRNQPIGDIFIEEAEEGVVERGLQAADDRIIIAIEGDRLSRHKFSKTPTATVLPGEGGTARDALQIERIWMNDSRDEIHIQIKDFSDDVPSTIHLTDLELTIDRTAPEGPVEAYIYGGSIIDGAPDEVGTASAPYFLQSWYLHKFDIANVINPADAVEEDVEVGFTVGETTYMVNGQMMTMDVAPFVQDGRMMVPVRYLEPVFGVQPSWSDSARTVTIPYQGSMYSMEIGSHQLKVNGSPMIDMEAPAQIVSDRTFVPISRFARAMGIEYDWDAAAQSVTFYR